MLADQALHFGIADARPGDEKRCQLAMRLVARLDQCLPVSASLSMEEAAALPETLFTVWHNVFERGYACDGETILVHGGTSGIGTMAIKLGKLFGLKVIVTCGSDAKCDAAKALGAGHTRIILRHILPNVMGPVMVLAASNFASAIVMEAGLSFLGVGVQSPQPSWGLMIKENYNFIITHNPMLAVIPGLAIMVLVLAFNLLGNGLRDAMDVRRG